MSKRWGEPTWYFFHVFAEKITPTTYMEKQQEIHDLFFSICSSLPCPYCKDHAMAYLKKYKLSNLKNKEELKIYFYNFHNSVNKQKKQNVYGKDILKKYEKVSIVNAYKFFNQEFFKTVYLSKHFSGWIRDTLKQKIFNFMKNNIAHFTR